MSQKRVLKADWAFTATGDDLIPQAAVATTDDRITYVGPVSELGQDHLEDAIVEDFPCHTLMPGMLDGHIHLSFTAGSTHPEVVDYISRETDMQQVVRTAANAQKCLRAGLTTVRDLGARRDVVPTVRDAINRGQIAGPRILSCNFPITVTGGHLHFVGWEADEEWELRRAVRTLVKEGADVIKICASGGNMTAESNPLMVQYSAEQLSMVVEEAHKLDTPVAAHAIPADSIRNCIEAGIDTIEHCVWLGADGGYDYDEDAMATAVAKGLTVSITIAGVLRGYLDDQPNSALLREAMNIEGPIEEERVEHFRKIWQSGVNLIVSSDAGVRYTPPDDYYISLQCAVELLGIPPKDVLHMATYNPAKGLDVLDERGTLETGKVADVIAVEGNPLADIKAMANVKLTIVGGKVMYRDGMIDGPRTLELGVS
ncbi:MAG: amidohydrolase family protein [Chloroflexi bacterium]|nr:amidohydrolase family protein [Chloroflexota bacterium]